MRTIRTFPATLLALASLIVLSSCGGGGGGGGNTNLPPITYSIMGIVSGAPQGTTVALSGNKAAATTTNSIGDYQFTGLSNGSYTVTPSMPGYVFSPASKPVTISNGNAVNTDFTVTNAYAISGTVAGAPQGVTITLSGDATATATTNSIGYYEFSGLLSGSYTVTPSMPGYTLSPASRSVSISSANAGNTNFAVVFGIAGNAGVSDVTITLVDSSGTATTRLTDTNGNYSALGLAAGTYTISASLAGYSMNPLNQKATVTCDVKTGVDFTATPGTTYSIVGTASNGGVALNLSGSNSGVIYTSLSGTYSFSGLLAGSYTITPSGGSILTQTCTQPISLSNTDLTCDFTFRMMVGIGAPPPACLSLSGTISGAISSAVTITVNAFRSPTPYLRTATTDNSGNYLVSIPSSTYVITPSMIGYTFSPPRICGAVSLCDAVSPTSIPGNNFISQ
jgi:hypothetical protein